MKRPTKFVAPLTPEQEARLEEILKTAPTHRRRMRAHAVLLSHRKYSVDEIADIYQADRDRVSQWLDWWGEEEFEGLDDDPRSGRPPKLSGEEQREVVRMADEDGRSSRGLVGRVATELSRVVGADTIRRVLSEADRVWKRLRRGLSFWRDEDEFRWAEADLKVWREACAAPDAEFDLWYYDEAGFTLSPTVPYAWQPRGATWELATATHERRQNVLGFLNLHGDFESFVFEDRVDAPLVVACFEHFRRRLTKPTLVVLDNAAIHTGEEFQDAIDEWRADGLYVRFLPPYSPELNLIEILWRFIKYRWLPLDATQSFDRLTEALLEVLAGVGSKYRITFA